MSNINTTSSSHFPESDKGMHYETRHDGQGMCLYAKRLERGRFIWPSTAPREGAERAVILTPAQLGYLLEGIDWRLPQHTWRPQAAG